MSKKIFEEDSDFDEEIKFQTNNEFAKKYDDWRKKEELNKLKTKYGEEESSSSSDDDDEGEQITEEIEKQFFKTLACLKNKDPCIYDENVKFFHDVEDKSKQNQKKVKEKPMYISDYERELILKTNGEFSDTDEPENARARSPTYIEEQKQIKESFKNALNEVDDDDDDDGNDNEWGGMLKIRQKTQEEKAKEEAEYKEWLAGQKEEINDKETETELKPLKDYWSSPNLDDGEKFLRDYILKKKFLNREDEDYIPTYEEIIHDSDKDLSEDEETIDKQEEFEHKYNFRFEEPDQEFIKRYPRTVEHSLRKTDDRRKLKRAETKERKQKEKQQKMQEIKKLQELKRKEIEEKIQKLKEITGNDNIGFKDEDLDGDFDPEAHDKRMQSLFNDEFYEGCEEDQKPEFPELDEYLELENWEKWKGDDNDADGEEMNEEYAPHCEDEDFNMDCDYDPKAALKEELVASSKGKKKRKRKSLFAKAVSQPKPVFDPKDKSYEEYLDEYYKLDCEDIIGDIPCRFKYRKVIPNSFGLTIEEILKANDRELNRWCSLKKAMQYRPDHMEKYDQIAYSKKAENLALKRKILPSLFENDETDKVEIQTKSKKKKKKKSDEVKSDDLNHENINEDTTGNTTVLETDKVVVSENVSKKKKKKKKKIVKTVTQSSSEKSEGTTETAVGECNGTNKKKRKKGTSNNPTLNSNDKAEKINTVDETNVVNQNVRKKKKKIIKNRTELNTEQKVVKKRKSSVSISDDVPRKKVKKSKNQLSNKQNIGISDARLSAYGINPKKFKNKLKYGKK